MKSNTSVIYTVSLVGIFLLGYILWNIDYSDSSTPLQGSDYNDFICGTAGPRTALENEGNLFFKVNCAACHKPLKAMIGPSLITVIDKFPTDSLLLVYIKKEKPQGGRNCLTFNESQLKDSKALLTYINSFR